MKKNLIKIATCIAVMFIFGKTAAAQSTMPTFSNDQEKEAWVKAHPEEYKKILATPATTTVSNGSTMGTSDSQPSGQVVKVSGFPAYVNTGNKEKDDANYMAAKQAWIAANPEEYKKMTQSPK